LKRERPDDRPLHVSQPPVYDQLYHTRNVKTYDKSRLPPGKFFLCIISFIDSIQDLFDLEKSAVADHEILVIFIYLI
jgi:hypothetical protein